MTLKRAFLCVFSLLALVLAALLVVLGMSRQAREQVTKAETRRYESFKLADELRQSSDDLTRMVRTYVVTGNPAYREYFHEILAIRNGSRARPVDYDKAYWDLVDASGNRPSPDGKAQSLASRMREMNFSEQEFSILREAQEKSDTLVSLEETAMQAMVGTAGDSRGIPSADRKPNPELARSLVHGKEYHQAKAGIMAGINKFFDHIEARTSREVDAAKTRETFYQNLTWPLGLLAAALSVFSYVYLGRHAVAPVQNLSSHAVEFSKGNYHQHVETRGFAEIDELSTAFNQMSEAIVRDIEQRSKIQEELRVARNAAVSAYDRIKDDLDAAARVQRSLLPENMPEVPGVHFAYAYTPCDELAGDTLNVFQIDDTHIAVYLLDVSGHGVQAALLASALSHVLSPMKTIDSVLWEQNSDGDYTVASPAAVARKMNQQFPMDPRTNQYFTFHYGLLDLCSWSYRFISAGHPSPMRVFRDGRQERLRVKGAGIGILQHPVFEEMALSLSPGDRMLFFSDGILEADNQEGRQFQDEGLEKCIPETSGLPLEKCLEYLLASVSEWSQGVQIDDVSAVAMEISQPD